MNIQTKICGLKTAEAVNAAVEGGAAYLGFVFYDPSPRNINPEEANEISSNIPKEVKTVAVVVDPEDTLLDGVVEQLAPDFIQLHGHETPDRVKAIKDKYNTPIIKAFNVASSDDIASSRIYTAIADMLLFDARSSGALPGGNGLQFDWHLLHAREFPLPWILSGGLNADNIAQAVRISGATIVDVSSSVEVKPGEKDPKLISAFLECVSRL